MTKTIFGETSKAFEIWKAIFDAYQAIDSLCDCPGGDIVSAPVSVGAHENYAEVVALARACTPIRYYASTYLDKYGTRADKSARADYIMKSEWFRKL